MTKLIIAAGDGSPPIFFDALTQADVDYLKSKKKRLDMSCVLGVARRCIHGRPQVILCKPLSKDFTPFPTAFWLTCSFLERACGALEACGGVSMLECAMSKCEDEVLKYHDAHIKLRMSLIADDDMLLLKAKKPQLIKQLTSRGIGGTENPRYAKCLHLHVASWLGFGYHPCMPWLSRNFPVTECKGEHVRDYPIHG